MGVVSGASVAMALLQSLCTAVLTVNSVRLGIGLAALTAGSIAGPLVPFHRDAIRIPMLVIATVGAVINLAVLAWVWRQRARPEAQWRRRELTKKQRVSERLQVAMAILTLVLVGLEVWTHAILHRPQPASAAATARESTMVQTIPICRVGKGLITAGGKLFIQPSMKPLAKAGRQFEDTIIGNQDNHVAG